MSPMSICVRKNESIVMKHNLLIVNLLSLFLGLKAQAQTVDAPAITKNFKFRNGVYKTFEAWQKNRPTWVWDSLDVGVLTNPQTFLTQVEHLTVRKTGLPIVADSIWGVVLDGIPYLRLSKTAINKPLTAFAGLQLRGKICYFSYETTQTVRVPITAYNPFNGIPFISKIIENERIVIHEKMLLFETGAIQDLTPDNFKLWVTDDKDLTTAVGALKGDALNERLFKCLLIYDDRHPVYVK
jgi:hypothetical protein